MASLLPCALGVLGHTELRKNGSRYDLPSSTSETGIAESPREPAFGRGSCVPYSSAKMEAKLRSLGRQF